MSDENDSKHLVVEESAPLVVGGGSTDGDGAPLNNRVPRAVYFIICNEISERFSFYALKSILALYLSDYLGFSEDGGTSAHCFCTSPTGLSNSQPQRRRSCTRLSSLPTSWLFLAVGLATRTWANIALSSTW